MKRVITSVLVAIATVSCVFCKTIHVDHAYLMKKHKDGSVYVIRVHSEDGYHDWYVISTDKPWMFRGYEGDDVIIVDKTTDIAIVAQY